MNNKNASAKAILKDCLLKLDKRNLKLFYGILVHYWTKNYYFISKQNFFNLWCELNELCHIVDKSFPEPHNDRELLKSYCIAYPYYFIDILDSEMVIKLLCEHLNDRICILATIANELDTEGLWAAYDSSNKALGLSENIDELVAGAEEHLAAYSKF